MGRYKSVERAPAGRGVWINLRGRVHEASYVIDGPMLTVESVLFGVKRRPLGDQPPEVLARLMLAEMVDEHERLSRSTGVQEPANGKW